MTPGSGTSERVDNALDNLKSSCESFGQDLATHTAKEILVAATQEKLDLGIAEMAFIGGPGRILRGPDQVVQVGHPREGGAAFTLA